jgi:hypothetical protein
MKSLRPTELYVLAYKGKEYRFKTKKEMLEFKKLIIEIDPDELQREIDWLNRNKQDCK